MRLPSQQTRTVHAYRPFLAKLGEPYRTYVPYRTAILDHMSVNMKMLLLVASG